LRFRKRRELGPFHADVRSTLVDRRARFLAALIRDAAQNPAEWMRKADVPDEAASEEAAGPPLRAVEELIGNDDVGRFVCLFEAADRAGRENEFDAERLHAEDVRAEIQLRRRQAMATAMSRQERDPFAAQRAEHVRRRRLA